MKKALGLACINLAGIMVSVVSDRTCSDGNDRRKLCAEPLAAALHDSRRCSRNSDCRVYFCEGKESICTKGRIVCCLTVVGTRNQKKLPDAGCFFCFGGNRFRQIFSAFELRCGEKGRKPEIRVRGRDTGIYKTADRLHLFRFRKG